MTDDVINVSFDVINNNSTDSYFFTPPINLSSDAFNISPSGHHGRQRVTVAMGYVYFYLTAIMSVLSIVGTTVIFIIYGVFKDLRTSGRRLLLFLSIADFLTAFGNFLGIVWYSERDSMSDVVERVFCRLHASLTIASSICSFLWTMSIAVHLYICVGRKNAGCAKRLTIPFHLFCWTIPVIVASLAWSSNILGHDENVPWPSWCWIDPDAYQALFWQYLTGKAWEIICYVVTATLYLSVKCTLYRQIKTTRDHLGKAVKKNNHSVIEEANRKLMFVPLVFISLRIWGTIRFIIGAHFSHRVTAATMAWIVPLQGVGDSAQGFANCLMFCVFTSRIRQRCREALIGTCLSCLECIKEKRRYTSDHVHQHTEEPLVSSGEESPKHQPHMLLRNIK